MLRHLMALLLLGSVPWLMAQDQPAKPPPALPGAGRDEHNAGGRPGEEFRHRLKQAVDRKLAELQKTDPQRHDELVKLREENPVAFMREMKQVFGAEWEAGAGGLGLGKHLEDRLLDEWKQRNPDEFKGFDKLREEDPEQAREMLRNLFTGFRRKHFGSDDEARRLAQTYHQTADGQEKEKLKADMQKAVETSFDDRLENQQQEVDAMAARLAEVKAKLAQFKEQRTAICEKRLNQLLTVSPDDVDGPPARKHPGKSPRLGPPPGANGTPAPTKRGPSAGAPAEL